MSIISNSYNVQPTYAGLRSCEAFCAAAGFPLPDLRLEICTTKWVIAYIPEWKPPLGDGRAADLKELSERDPDGSPANFMLSNLERGYGIRFLETRTTAEPSSNSDMTMGMRYSYSAICMEPYGGDGVFPDFVERHRDELAELVRYGKIVQRSGWLLMMLGRARNSAFIVPR